MNPYRRIIVSCERPFKSLPVDVYAVLTAFDVTCPATAHAIKKLLAAGTRGDKDKITDLKEAIASIYRAIELAENKP